MPRLAYAYTCGVDLHRDSAQICVVDARGERVQERRFTFGSATTRTSLLDFIVGLGRVEVAVESVGMNRWFVNGLEARGLVVGQDLLVVHAAFLRLSESGKKTDRRDAREIARRLHLGDLRRRGRSYYATEAECDTRRLLRTRRELVKQRQQCISTLRGMFRAYALSMPRGTLWSQSSLQWLSEHVTQLPTGAFAAGSLVCVLQRTQQEILRLETEIRRRARRDRRASDLMREVPQVAELTALTLVAELGDLSRFDGPRQAAAYPGLVPSVNDSGDAQRHGRLIKPGNRHLRWILGQVAVRLLASNARVKQWAVPYRKRMPTNRIRTALARRLLVGIYRSQQRGERFSLERCLGMKP